MPRRNNKPSVTVKAQIAREAAEQARKEAEQGGTRLSVKKAERERIAAEMAAESKA